MEETVQTDCRRHSSHDCQATGSTLNADVVADVDVVAQIYLYGTKNVGTCVQKHLYVASLQMHLDSPEALGVLNTLFESVAPSSLRPVDMLLKSMFTIPVTMVRSSHI